MTDHRSGYVEGINTISPIHQMTREIPRSTPDIKNRSWSIDDEIGEDIDGLVGIRRAVMIGFRYALVLKGRGGVGTKEVGFRLQVGQVVPPMGREDVDMSSRRGGSRHALSLRSVGPSTIPTDADRLSAGHRNNSGLCHLTFKWSRRKTLAKA